MTNRQRFFLNGLLLTAVAIAVRSVSLIFNSFITHNIGAEGMGLFTLIGTVYSFAVTFATSGISLTVTRLTSSAIGKGKAGEVVGVLRSATAYSLVFSIFASLTLFIGAPYFAGTVLSDLRAVRPLRVLAVSLVPLALSSVFSGYFVGVKRVGRNALVQVLGQVFRITVTSFFILRYAKLGVEEGTVALCLSMTLTEILVFLVALVEFLWDKRRNFRRKNPNEAHFPEVCKMALPLALSAYIRSALLTIEHILIPKRLRDGGNSHTDALAAYGVLHGMALPVLLFPMSPLTSFSGLLVPEFSESMARGENSRMQRISSEALNTTLVYSIAAMAFVALFSEEIGYAAYSSYSAGYYIALMAPVLPIMYLDHVTDAMLKGIGEHVYSMWVNISDSFLSVILVWFLIPRMGISGYAVVIVVMEGYNFILSAIRLYKRVKFRISPVRAVLLPLVAAFFSSYVAKHTFINIGSRPSPVWLFLEIIFAVCIFTAVYLTFSLISKRKNKTSQA